ncbi:MAG: VOC family protein [Chloroflexi bacterium]|nr:VOC family protein [Chloroflexota bacterium]
MIYDFNHASITVSNLERSIQFYCENFGMELRRKTEGGGIAQVITGYPGAHLKIAFLKLKENYVELIEYVHPESKRPEVIETKDVGGCHLSFASDNIYQDYETMKAKGIRFKSPPTVTSRGKASCYGLDPDGITFELQER